MEYPSTWKATSVATAVAAIMGTISPNPLWVSSSTRARPDSGACMAAPIMAAAQTMANAPDGDPGQARFHAMPSAPPRTAPVLSVGVNSPPDAPLPRQRAVTSGLSANSVSIRLRPLRPRNASRAMSRPLPNSCGYQMPMTPRMPKAISGANSTLVPLAR